MAVLSDYTSGTISLANGSTTVTGTGTLFEVTRFREGDTLQIQNLTAVIASVDSDTQLTLTEPWTGTSIVDGPYRARQLADGTRVGTQAATLIELLGDGTLAGIAALGVEEGKSLVGGPAGQYELVDTSTFGIQDPNGSLGELAALTLAANKAITTDGSGNAQQIDLGTLGRALLALTGTNGNIPVMTGAGTVASRPIVGTVSQSGGIPTGALVEYGTNAGGQYFKFAGGLMICRAVRQGPQWVNVAEGALFRTAGNSYTFAASFSETPSISLFAEAPYAVCWAVANAVTNNSFYGRVFSPYLISENASITHIAVGRWHL